MAEAGGRDRDHRSDRGEGGGSGSRVEISATAGWTFSNGVEADSSLIVPGVGTFTSIDPKDAFSWGLRLGFFGGTPRLASSSISSQPTRARRNDDHQARRPEDQQLPRLLRLQLWWRRCRGWPVLLFGLGATSMAR